MTVLTETSRSLSPPAGSGVAELKRFVLVSFLFLAGLILFVIGLDRIMGMWLEKSGHRGGIAPDVQKIVDTVNDRPQKPRLIVLGDSVGRQLFRHGNESSDDVRYMTTNAGISMAGQFFLAQSAIEHFPHLKDIYLVTIPFALDNNIPREYSHDFFCGHFHSTSQVAEVFLVKRDLELSFAHAGRWMLPNLMAANSLSQPASAVQPRAGAPRNTVGTPPAPDPERLLTEFSAWIGPKPEPVLPVPPGKLAVHLSPVSRNFLEKLRRLCQERGIRLHVLPAPVSAEYHGVEIIDPEHIYDAPILNDVPADHLIDGIHFKKQYVPAERARVISYYHLTFAKGVHESDATEP